MVFTAATTAVAAAAAFASAVPSATATTTFATSTVANPIWTPVDMVLPYPYQRPSIRLTSDTPAATTAAVFAVLSVNACGGGTSFASTTTVTLAVDCLGAAELAVSIARNPCPLGQQLPPATVDTVTSTPRTQFSFSCAPTPALSSSSSTSYQLADVTRTMPVPSLGPGETPPETPTALEVVHHADGTCRVVLGLQQADAQFRSRRERVDHECLAARLHPTVYAATVTRTITVACDGCAYVRGGDMTTLCPRSITSVAAGTETATVSTATTRWRYDCEPRQ